MRTEQAGVGEAARILHVNEYDNASLSQCVASDRCCGGRDVGVPGNALTPADSRSDEQEFSLAAAMSNDVRI